MLVEVTRYLIGPVNESLGRESLNELRVIGLRGEFDTIIKINSN